MRSTFEQPWPSPVAQMGFQYFNLRMLGSYDIVYPTEIFPDSPSSQQIYRSFLSKPPSLSFRKLASPSTIVPHLTDNGSSTRFPSKQAHNFRPPPFSTADNTGFQRSQPHRCSGDGLLESLKTSAQSTTIDS